MKNIVLLFLSVFLVAASAVAQAGDPPAAEAPAQSPPLQVQLTPVTMVVETSGIAKLRLTIEIVADCEVPQALLSGNRLDVYYGGEKRYSFGDEAEVRKVPLVAGTRIQRVLDADMKLVLGGGRSDVDSVTFKWRGLDGAEAQVTLIADQATIDLDRLDYSKTRVLLRTNFGEIAVSFRPDKAPNHVRNFVKLAQTGFYNGTKFHRVIQDFMIQGGCPNTKPGATGLPGTGDAGYKIDAEFSDLKHLRGVLSAARSRDVNSAGSQFFLMHGANPALNGQYTAFGKIESGLDVLDKIATTPCGGQNGSTPRRPVHLHSAIVLPVYKN